MFKVSYYLPTEIVFKIGALNELPEKAKSLGKKALIVTGRTSTKKTGLLQRVQNLLKEAGVESIVYDKIIPNPISDHVDEAAEIVRKEGVDFIVGLGGGSPIDSAKAISITAPNEGKFWDYVPVGGGKIPEKSIPVVAIPTTHGTGTEADPFAVITNPETKEKVGIGYRNTFPVLSIVDPEVMKTLPKDQTAYTSMDAFYHAIEAFLNINANPYSDVLALDSMKRIVTYLPIAYENGEDIEARTNLAWASTEAGITETLTGVIANHALEHGLSGFYPEITHGLGLCITGPYLFEYIFDHAYERLAIVGREVFGVYETNDKKAGRLAIKKLRDFQEMFGLNKKLSELGVKKEDIPKIAETGYRVLNGVVVVTPGNLTAKDMEEILYRCY
ncbi:iron-containing alcohol dehydrogenase [Thermotoga sp. KOL6]|uniref:iron-containing alcohol dehydrogenase n=1 Tax=Thermotoga sp. KOL6 TaxID=126741 RepID=UPI000C75B40F|nr:iron-containing alcohol dehydrogenase [Thermotoga sp. KOL6]PLV58707.1 alcohol dehydrogenase [Thermotoga sp. KOL6]